MKAMELQLMAGVPFSAGLLIRSHSHGIYFCVLCEILPGAKVPIQIFGAWASLN